MVEGRRRGGNGRVIDRFFWSEDYFLARGMNNE
jgi:hypothetical protein